MNVPTDKQTDRRNPHRPHHVGLAQARPNNSSARYIPIETSALSGSTWVMIAESAKQVHLSDLSFEKREVTDSERDLRNALSLCLEDARMPSYLLSWL